MSSLVLASRSAVRVKLLADAGLQFVADAADLDEEALVVGIADIAEQARALARAKALCVAARHPHAYVLGGDQVGAILDGNTTTTLLEKPRDPAHHVAMLLAMSGRTHRFVPAVALVRGTKVLAESADVVDVRFRAFDEDTARRYAASGEGKGSCGGYESEHRGAQLIEHVDGSLQAVLGFPLLRVLTMLRVHAPGIAGLL